MSSISRRLIAGVSLSKNLTCNACRWSSAWPQPSKQSGLQAHHLSTSVLLLSGHSKWATIKHDKGKNDAAKTRQRSIFSRDIANASRLFGPDPNTNPRLAMAISSAKKAGIPKAVIEGAIARGQGISSSGTALDSIVVEAILPPSIATVIDCQTDNKLRTLADIRLIIKEHEGNVTPTNYLFEKKGRIIFQRKEGTGADDILEDALDAGALDVIENESGQVVVFTESSKTKATAESLARSLGLEIEEAEIIWDPNKDTQVGIDDEAGKKLSSFLEEVQEVTGVQGVYMNFAKGDIADDVWSDLRSRVVV